MPPPKFPNPRALLAPSGISRQVLEVPLPSWPFSKDALTVWRRKRPCITDDGVFGFVPAEEELRPAVACAALEHLLAPA